MVAMAVKPCLRESFRAPYMHSLPLNEMPVYQRVPSNHRREGFRTPPALNATNLSVSFWIRAISLTMLKKPMQTSQLKVMKLRLPVGRALSDLPPSWILLENLCLNMIERKSFASSPDPTWILFLLHVWILTSLALSVDLQGLIMN